MLRYVISCYSEKWDTSIRERKNRFDRKCNQSAQRLQEDYRQNIERITMVVFGQRQTRHVYLPTFRSPKNVVYEFSVLRVCIVSNF